MGLQPGEEGGVAQQAILQNLGVAGAHLPVGQGGEHIQVRQDEPGLVEGADQVLASRGVDGRLAAHRGVHLGQQGGGDLNEVCAALVDGGGEAGEVPDHPAAESDNQVAPVQLQSQQGVAERLQAGKALGLFAGGQDDGMDGQAGRFEGPGQPRAVQAPDGLVRDHGDPVATDEGAQARAGLVQQARTDQDIIGALAQVDMNGADHAEARACQSVRARITSSTVTWCGESPVSTVMSARP